MQRNGIRMAVGVAMTMGTMCLVLGGCGDGPGQAEELAPPLRPIPPEAKARAQEPQFEAYRMLLRAQFDATKRLGDFYQKATANGSRPLSPEDLDRHGALRGETDRLAAECNAFIEANFPNEAPEVLQQIYNEEQLKAFPDG
ncbi:MAG: hypothetical protein JNL80_12345 [Phycisphaerae bacterium]|nr:hypothetical protein [Phycisphaerae bacterium]